MIVNMSPKSARFVTGCEELVESWLGSRRGIRRVKWMGS